MVPLFEGDMLVMVYPLVRSIFNPQPKAECGAMPTPIPFKYGHNLNLEPKNTSSDWMNATLNLDVRNFSNET